MSGAAFQLVDIIRNVRADKCFPDSPLFRKMLIIQFTEKLNDHEIKKMIPVIDKLMANKCFTDYNWIPHHSNYVYVEHIRKTVYTTYPPGPPPYETCISIFMRANIRVQVVQKALDNIQRPKHDVSHE